MSLTSCLKSNPQLKKSLPQLKDDITSWDGSSFNWKTPLLVQSIGISHEAGLIGTAFDYTARSIIARLLYPNITLEQEFIAEKALDQIIEGKGIPFTPNQFGLSVAIKSVGIKLVEDDEIINDESKISLIDFVEQTKLGFKKYCVKMYLDVLRNRDSYIHQGGNINEFIGSSLFLAKLDSLYRTKNVSAQQAIIDHFLQDVYGSQLFSRPTVTRMEMIENISSLSDVFLDNLNKVAPKTAILNPSFGRYSILLGGADADLIIDDTIIDVKTTKKFGYVHDDYAQLLAYAAMGRRIGMNINKAAIYYARYGVFGVLDLNPLHDLLEQYLDNIENIANASKNTIVKRQRYKSAGQPLIKNYLLYKQDI